MSTLLLQDTTVSLRQPFQQLPDCSPTSSPCTYSAFSTWQPPRSLQLTNLTAHLLACLTPFIAPPAHSCLLFSLLWPGCPHQSPSSSHPGLISVSCMCQVCLPRGLCICCSFRPTLSSWFAPHHPSHPASNIRSLAMPSQTPQAGSGFRTRVLAFREAIWFVVKCSLAALLDSGLSPPPDAKLLT